MRTNNSFPGILLLSLATIILSCKTVQAQSATGDSIQRIKWTKQLPVTVRKAFNGSRYSNWFIEKMFSYNKEGKTVYAFYLNNSNLLDGDHREGLVRKKTLTFSALGTIVHEDNTDPL